MANQEVTLNKGWPTFFPQPPILFKSSSYSPHKQKTSKFHSETKVFSKKKVNAGKKSIFTFPTKNKVFSKKKVNAGNQSAIRHRLATSDMARYKLWNIFRLKYFPQLQCATTNHPIMHRRLATPALNTDEKVYN